MLVSNYIFLGMRNSSDTVSKPKLVILTLKLQYNFLNDNKSDPLHPLPLSVPLMLKIGRHSSVTRYSVTSERIRSSSNPWAKVIFSAIALFSIALVLVPFCADSSFWTGGLLKLCLEFLWIVASNGFSLENIRSFKNDWTKDSPQLCAVLKSATSSSDAIIPDCSDLKVGCERSKGSQILWCSYRDLAPHARPTRPLISLWHLAPSVRFAKACKEFLTLFT